VFSIFHLFQSSIVDTLKIDNKNLEFLLVILYMRRQYIHCKIEIKRRKLWCLLYSLKYCVSCAYSHLDFKLPFHAIVFITTYSFHQAYPRNRGDTTLGYRGASWWQCRIIFWFSGAMPKINFPAINRPGPHPTNLW